MSAMTVQLKTAAVALVACLALLGTGVLDAQEPTGNATITGVSDQGFPAVDAVVSIEGFPPELSRSMTAENFKATLGGNPVPVTAASLASSTNEPLWVLFVIDTSGSMEGAPLAQAKEASKAFIGGLGPEDRVAVLHFGDAVALVQDYTKGKAQAIAAIDGLQALGNTALYQATADGARKIAESNARRRAVILLSDGADFGGKSQVTRDESIGAARFANVPFFAIALGTDLDRAYLSELAEFTRGRFLEAPTADALVGLYGSIAEILQSQYVVTLDASSVRTAEGIPLRIEVVAGDQTAIAESTYVPSGGGPAAITIEGIKESDSIGDSREVRVVSEGGRPFSRVAFFVDGVNVFEADTAPYAFTYDPRAYGEGAHTLSVMARNGPLTSEASVSFSSTAPSTPPGGLPLAPIAGAGIALAAIVGAAYAFVRRRLERPAPAAVAQRITPWTSQIIRKDRAAGAADAAEEQESEATETIGEPLGMLISRGGSDLGSEYAVGGRPVSIGSAFRCGVRIKDGDLAAEEARIWVRKGHLMLHKMTRMTIIASDGVSGGWQILEPGDTFDIGEHRFEFRLLPEESPLAETKVEPEVTGSTDDDRAIPNILRDAGDARPLQEPAFGGAEPSRLLSDLMPLDRFGRDDEEQARAG